MSSKSIRIAVKEENIIALEATAEREGLSVTDTLNRAIQMYVMASALPPGKQMEVERPDGAEIYIQCPHR